MDIFAEDIQINATIIKEATGIAFIICKIGLHNSSKIRTRNAKNPSKLPKNTAQKNPIPTFIKE